MFSVGSRDSSVGIAIRYGLDGLGIEFLLGARFSAPVQTGPEALSFPRVKQSGRGLDNSLPSNAEVKERVGLYFYPPFRPSWPVLG